MFLAAYCVGEAVGATPTASIVLCMILHACALLENWRKAEGIGMGPCSGFRTAHGRLSVCQLHCQCTSPGQYFKPTTLGKNLLP